MQTHALAASRKLIQSVSFSQHSALLWLFQPCYDSSMFTLP